MKREWEEIGGKRRENKRGKRKRKRKRKGKRKWKWKWKWKTKRKGKRKRKTQRHSGRSQTEDQKDSPGKEGMKKRHLSKKPENSHVDEISSLNKKVGQKGKGSAWAWA
jgi:hypothetical protein